MEASMRLKGIIAELGDYPQEQNERPLYRISGEELLYYRRWYDKMPEKRLGVETANKAANAPELQRMMGL